MDSERYTIASPVRKRQEQGRQMREEREARKAAAGKEKERGLEQTVRAPCGMFEVKLEPFTRNL